MYLNTDHSGLNKFCGPDDENFLLVWPEVNRMVKNAPQKAKERFNCKVQLLFTLYFLPFRVSLIIVKHTPLVLKTHKDNTIAQMTRR